MDVKMPPIGTQGKDMLRFYLTTLTGSLAGPRQLFSQLPQDLGFKKPLGYLTISSLIFSAAAAVTAVTGNPALFAGLYLVNAVGMTFISAGLGYLLIFALRGGRQVSFQLVFGVYAISSGTTLLAAWIPYFLIITEPWKWWLIGTGISRCCCLTYFQALWIVILSLGVIVCGFGLILPLTLPGPM